MAKLPEKPPQELDVLRFIDRPKIKDEVLTIILADLDRTVAYYEIALKEYRELLEKSGHTETDLIFEALAPLLVALAVAIRFTKVTGELRLESVSAVAAASRDKEESSV